MSLDWIYYAISWILLRWHALWDAIGIPEYRVLGTNWSWVLAIVFLVVTVRVILFPVFVKQIKSQRAMQALQPKVKELQDKHKGDRETLQKEMMELYRTEKANPLMGCLPMFLQIPVFLGLFHVLRRLNPDLPEKYKTLYGWSVEQFNSAANSALFSAPLPSKFGSSAEELAALDANSVTVKIVAGILVLVMMTTTYLTSRQMILKTGWAEDPQQKMIQRLMLYGIPLSLLVSGGLFPIGVIIYWVTNNLFTLAQQQWVLRKFPPAPMAGSRGPGPRPAGGSGAAKGGSAKSPVQPARTGGLFGRGKASAEPESPVVDTKALAPKPGAKPTNPKKGARPANKPQG
ncbi:YidC/Oxa1 family membrane protein insertase [Krasilnikovia cinnamomea]|uniref:Membrane protein insertase YidC n=1 Tax=Krasilnikovia cinnamomea TaxID=349313 RepID=A0A4Q7ZJF8_9ACTN|nr:membrane protein insertase YidC [Krasilnikovia cinnamomea]RZU51012.1 YidC/Oxa1 family membrane protein insertase [Krasilnikovia cinnamomea]